jgi:hypothetical protein
MTVTLFGTPLGLRDQRTLSAPILGNLRSSPGRKMGEYLVLVPQLLRQHGAGGSLQLLVASG